MNEIDSRQEVNFPSADEGLLRDQLDRRLIVPVKTDTEHCAYVRELDLGLFFQDNEWRGEGSQWKEKFNEKYTRTEGALSYRIYKANQSIEDGDYLLNSGEIAEEVLKDSLIMREKLRIIYKELELRIEDASEKEKNLWMARVDGFLGARDVALFEPNHFFETPKKRKGRLKLENKAKVAQALNENPKKRRTVGEVAREIALKPFVVLGSITSDFFDTSLNKKGVYKSPK